jgi:hypothetical protein
MSKDMADEKNNEFRTLLDVLDENTELDIESSDEDETSKKKRGGARAGAGRKRQYAPMMAKRLKCRIEHANLARAFISILDKFSKFFDREATMPCMIDGSLPEEKGSGNRSWKDYDAISSKFYLDINGSWDKRLFAVAFKKTKPTGVMLDVIHDREVRLRWQRIDEVARVMKEYGWLMARKNRLDSETAFLLDKVPIFSPDIPDWANFD